MMSSLTICPKLSATSPPPTPVVWLWECHKCGRRWPLGVTRRCLIDGHRFCGRQEERSRLGKRKKARRACWSRFGYSAWQARNVWRRRELVPDPEHKDCWYWCDYPSQCRWEPNHLVTTTTFNGPLGRSSSSRTDPRLFLSVRQRSSDTLTPRPDERERQR
jgi:hypothetical protein